MEVMSSYRKKCGTCLFWSGMRTTDTYMETVKYDGSSKGICQRDNRETIGNLSCSSWKQGFGKNKGKSAEGIEKLPGSTGEAIDALAGVAFVGSVKLVGFGLKGIWKIIVFPFWLMFWLGKLLFLMFKCMFYTFPRFLFRKGKVGKICLIVYIVAWVIAISTYMIINHIEEKKAIEIVTVVPDISVYITNKIEGRAIITIPLNSTIKVLKQNTESGWAKIKFDRRTGYVKLEDLNIISDKKSE